MRSTFRILIFYLYALGAVNATLFSKRGSAEVQQGNANAAKPLNFWSDDKSDDDDKDDKWSKDGKDDKDNKDDDDECASRSIFVLIGTSTYAIPCLQGDSIVNLNGLIPTPTSSIASSSATEASSSVVSSSAVDSNSSAASSSAASSEASSVTDSTTTTDSTATTTDTTTSADSSPSLTVTLYDNADCTGNNTFTSATELCVDHAITQFPFSAKSTSTVALRVLFFTDSSCVVLFRNIILLPNACTQTIGTGNTRILSYRVSAI